MHDPMVVAFDIPRPWPQARRKTRPDGARLRLRPFRRHRWDLRPAAFSKFWQVGDYELYWTSAITVWHVEPNGHDALTVCERRGRWKWHVHHWRIQVAIEQRLRRFLFERCELCGRRYPWGYAPVSHQWDAPRSRWFKVEPHAYHHECSSLVSLRRERERDEQLIRHLLAEVRVRADESEAEVLARLTDPKNRSMDFNLSYRLTRLMGYERDDNYELVKREATR